MTRRLRWSSLAAWILAALGAFVLAYLTAAVVQLRKFRPVSSNAPR